MKNIEVEARSFISKEQYERLKEYFQNNAQFVKEDKQETIYFDCDQDLRIQKNDFYAKIWLKKGSLHDDCREELEIKFDKNDFVNLEKLFEELGYKTEIKWYRKRLEFDWDDVKVCLDDTKGYGYIIELEKMANEDEKDKASEDLVERMKSLDVEIAPKEEFQRKFTEYKDNWRRLTEE